MSDANLEINSREDVAYRLFIQVLANETHQPGSAPKRLSKVEMLTLYSQCLKIVKGRSVTEVLAE